MLTKVKVRKTVPHELEPPAQADLGAAGFDLRAAETTLVHPGTWALVDTGYAWAIPPGWCGQVYARSGLAVRQGLIVGAGLIDSSYRGSVKVLLHNLGDERVRVDCGQRFAQMVLVPCLAAAPEVVLYLDDTPRGDGGFGSTGDD